MTNREYQLKQHRGSSPLRTEERNFISIRPGVLPSEEWKNSTWYPFSTEPVTTIHNNGIQNPDA